MKRILTLTCVAFLFHCVPHGMCADPRPSFEVASVKSADPGVLRQSMNGGPGTSDPGRIVYGNISLEQVLTKAFNLRYDQIVGPSWLPYDKFDIVANVPLGTSADQSRLMLQTLLVDRFKMTFHLMKKEMQSYELVVGKNGPKLKSPTDAASQVGEDSTDRGPDDRQTAGSKGDNFRNFEDPKHTSMRATNGVASLNAIKMSMAELAKLLAQELDCPVVDKTVLTGNYDFKLTYPAGGSGLRGIMLAPGGVPDVRTPESDNRAGVATALESQLGLRLETKKSPVDVLVIDHLKKVPSPD